MTEPTPPADAGGSAPDEPAHTQPAAPPSSDDRDDGPTDPKPDRARSAGPGRQPTDESANDAENPDFDPDSNQRLSAARRRGLHNFSDMPIATHIRDVADVTGPVAVGDDSVAAGSVHGFAVGAQYGTQISAQSVNIGLPRRPNLAWRISRETLRTTARWFIELDGSATRKELEDALRTRPVAVLAGPRGSGRTELAIHALHSVLPPDSEIATFRVGPERAQLHEIRLRRGDGYVANVNAALDRRLLSEVAADIEGLAGPTSNRIVLIVDQERVPTGWRDAPLVPHAMPDRRALMCELLRLVHGRTEDPAVVLTESVISSIDSSSVADLTHAAAAVAVALDRGQPPDLYLRDSLRAKVAKQFDEPTDPEQERADMEDADGERAWMIAARWERARAWRRCAILAAAVFNGFPLRVVTETAIQLSQILYGDDPDATTKPLAFEQLDTKLLSWMEADLEPAGDPTAPDTLQFQNPAVPDVVLEHIWTSHHLAAASVIEWLDTLARVRRGEVVQPEEVRLRASQAVGRLARYDFERILAMIEKNWIRPGTVSGLEATSWAVEIMAGDPVIAQAVWKRVRAWSLRGQRWRRAALLVYATALVPVTGVDTAPARQTEDALDLVRRVAPLPIDLDFVVAAVLRSALLAGQRDAVLELMVDWRKQIEETRGRLRELRVTEGLRVYSGLPAHAARTLLLLCVSDDFGTRTKFLQAARRSPDIGAMAVAMWGIALGDPAITRRATELLRSWLEEADNNSAMAEDTGWLISRLIESSPLRSRLWFHAGRWITEWAGALPTAERILRTALGTPPLQHEGEGR